MKASQQGRARVLGKGSTMAYQMLDVAPNCPAAVEPETFNPEPPEFAVVHVAGSPNYDFPQ